MKTLYIFADSVRPDPCINSIVHCVLDRDVRAIKIIHIKGLGLLQGGGGQDSQGSGIQSGGFSGRLLGDVQAQLKGLAERGEYTFPEDHKRKGERLLLENEYDPVKAKQVQDFYRRCRSISVSYSNTDIDYSHLRTELRKIAKEKYSAYADISTIRKKYLGDIISAALVEGLQQLHTFDILLPTLDHQHPWKMLIHDLIGDQKSWFSYTNIINTPIYRDCSRVVVVRAPRLAFSAVATVVLLGGAFVIYWKIGSTNQIMQTVLAMSGIASLLSLVFVFVTPRSSV